MNPHFTVPYTPSHNNLNPHGYYSFVRFTEPGKSLYDLVEFVDHFYAALVREISSQILAMVSACFRLRATTAYDITSGRIFDLDTHA